MSAGNSCMYSSSRTLMALAMEGKAPRIFAKTTKQGVPIYALIPTFVLSVFFVFMTQLGAGKVFEFLVNLTGITILLAWVMISLIHIRFRQAFAMQGYSLDALPYVAPFHPYGDMISVGGSCIVVLGTIYSIVINPHKAGNLMVWVENLGILVVFPTVYFVHKFIYGTKWVPLEDCDFVTGCSEGTILSSKYSLGVPKMLK